MKALEVVTACYLGMRRAPLGGRGTSGEKRRNTEHQQRRCGQNSTHNPTSSVVNPERLS
jgi:hypothetical protein